MIKLGLAVATLATVICAPAMAADLRPVTKAPAMAVAVDPPANWTGFYLGGNLGYTWENAQGTYILPPPDNHNTSGSHVYGGAHAGLQGQFGMFVLGVEAAWTTRLTDDWNQSFSPTAACIASTADRTCQSRFNDIFQVGPRVGIAFDRFMVYATGGYATTKLQTRTLVTSTGVVTSASSVRHDGWYIGGGLEILVAKLSFADVVMGLEYQHMEFETVAHAFAAPANDRNMSADADIVRARVSLKFNPFGGRPVMASY